MTPDDRFERWLEEQYRQEPEPVDDGFTARVMAALPVQVACAPTGMAARAERKGRLRALAQAGEVGAMACAGLALFALSGSGLSGGEALLAVSSLLGLLLWWSLPQSGGSLWR